MKNIICRIFILLMALGMNVGNTPAQENQEKLPPVRAITQGPKFHWFGYYDHLQFDPSGRYALGMEVEFENRSPLPEDVVKVGMVDLANGDRWIELGESRSWNWQQGCMLQWLPGSDAEIIWNDRQGGKFVSYLLDTKTGKKRTLPGPVYTISPDGRWALYPDFRRLHRLRPGYGYAGLPDPNQDIGAPEDVGIWRMDLRTGEIRLLFSIADILKISKGYAELKGAIHWYNHLLFSPDGKRFAFLHRWRGPKTGSGFLTRLITANLEGKEMFVLDPNQWTSHFIWRDPEHILAWAFHPSQKSKFYLFKDRTDQVEVVGPEVMTVNGHCSYLPDKKWILNDTYPDKQHLQHPYLYEVQTGKRFPLGHFLSPPQYGGEWRCDTHPRFSPDGRKVIIDSPHGGNGRQMYLIDIGGVVNGPNNSRKN